MAAKDTVQFTLFRNKKNLILKRKLKMNLLSPLLNCFINLGVFRVDIVVDHRFSCHFL